MGEGPVGPYFCMVYQRASTPASACRLAVGLLGLQALWCSRITDMDHCSRLLFTWSLGGNLCCQAEPLLPLTVEETDWLGTKNQLVGLSLPLSLEGHNNEFLFLRLLLINKEVNVYI